MTGQLYRRLARAIHTVGAIAIGTYIYAPLGDDPTFTLVTQLVTVPVLALTGLGMWQQPRLLRLMRRRA